MKFEIINGETEHVAFDGKRKRSSTVLIRLGSVSFSKQALTLGAVLIICQIFDGFLTYLGLKIHGIEMEGNSFLRKLMEAYGTAPALAIIKLSAIGLVVLLTFHAHKRKWVRPIIFLLAAVYLALAVVPWVYIISSHVAE